MEEKPVDTTPVKEEIYFAWSSPSRLFKHRDKEYFTNVGAIVLLLLVILVFAREFVLIAAVLSIVFLIYVLSTVPPEEVPHKITSLGIESAGHFYRWDELVDFWLEEQWGQYMVVIRPYAQARIILLIKKENQEIIKELIAKQLPFRDVPQKTWADNAASWLSKKIPLDKPVS